jgi:hypothetical protein
LTNKPKFALDFGLKGQIQNAADSSVHNIVEGFESKTNPEPMNGEPLNPACRAGLSRRSSKSEGGNPELMNYTSDTKLVNSKLQAPNYK